jgi:hypothetical protein
VLCPEHGRHPAGGATPGADARASARRADGYRWRDRRDDPDRGEAAVGATIAVKSTSEQLEVSDENGQFRISGLAPGLWTVMVYWDDQSYDAGTVTIANDVKAIDLMLEPVED